MIGSSHRRSRRDCKYDNFMADASPLYDSPPHPFSNHMKRDFSGEAKHSSTRTRRPIKYYLVDFGLSRRYNPGDSEAPYLEPPGWGGDKTVPEFLASSNHCDPFPVDIYCIGNAIRRHFLEARSSFSPGAFSPDHFSVLHRATNHCQLRKASGS
jgi:hypothetical protein